MTSFIRKAVYRAVAGRRRKQGINENEALEKGLREKSAEFVESGSEVYAKA
jgi:hypothetical protein